MSKYTYPTLRHDDTIDNLHGTSISDPFRYLEDPNSESTKSFISAQNEVSKAFIETYPHRAKLKNKLTEVFNYERYSVPFKRGDKYFYFYNEGLWNQSVIYVMDKLDGEARVFLDVCIFSSFKISSYSIYIHKRIN